MENKQNIFLQRGFKKLPPQSKPVDSKELASNCKMNSYQFLKSENCCCNNVDEFKDEYVEVRFKNNRKDYFKICHDMGIVSGDLVAVESSPGHDIGVVTLIGILASRQIKIKGINNKTDEIKKVYRKAKQTDIQKWTSIIENENQILKKSKKIIGEFNINMKLNDIECQADGSKITFYYTAEDRVDFRELIKALAREFHARVEMKQIGTRQESARIGGLGPCGRELCCSSWMNNFNSVSTQAARTQQIMLNPQKLTGQCTKLKCCLNYEYPVYAEAIKMFPDSNIPLKTKKGIGVHVKSDIFKKIMWYSYTNDRSNLLGFTIEKVKEIIEQNRKGKYPEKLEDFAILSSGNNDSDNVVGQDEIRKMGLTD